ncbi:transporter [Barnesiella propionica]|nr:transporter [Barnesiella propionica]
MALIITIMLQKLKIWVLPIAMLSGCLFHEFINAIAFLAPILIFVMLLITYCRISIKELKITRFQLSLISIQIIGSLIVFGSLYNWDPLIAEGAFICVFCPTATAAPVIAGMLGGNISALVTYSLISNMSVAILSPFIFSFIGEHAEIAFTDSFLIICQEVLPLLILPFIISLVLNKFFPRLHYQLKSRQNISFYLWSLSLFIVVGRAVTFIMRQPVSSIPEEIAIAVISFIVCIAQFYIGRRVGKHYDEKIAGAQGLGQKNTVLAIWMALTYLNPAASIGPASYIVWQNSINSFQLYLKEKQLASSPVK